jgi:hypothetical protein
MRRGRWLFPPAFLNSLSLSLSLSMFPNLNVVQFMAERWPLETRVPTPIFREANR